MREKEISSSFQVSSLHEHSLPWRNGIETQPFHYRQLALVLTSWAKPSFTLYNAGLLPIAYAWWNTFRKWSTAATFLFTLTKKTCCCARKKHQYLTYVLLLLFQKLTLWNYFRRRIVSTSYGHVCRIRTKWQNICLQSCVDLGHSLRRNLNCQWKKKNY